MNRGNCLFILMQFSQQEEEEEGSRDYNPSMNERLLTPKSSYL